MEFQQTIWRAEPILYCQNVVVCGLIETDLTPLPAITFVAFCSDPVSHEDTIKSLGYQSPWRSPT